MCALRVVWVYLYLYFPRACVPALCTWLWCGCGTVHGVVQVYERHLYTGVRTTDPEEIVTYDSQRIPIRVQFTLTYEIQDPSKASQ